MNDRNKVYRKAILRFGHNLQMLMAVEEMSELTKEIVKLFRKYNEKVKPDQMEKAGLIEEIADVRIKVEQLEEMFQCKGQVDLAMEIKISRLKRRIGYVE